MNQSDVIINMRGLNSVVVSEDRNSVYVGGGALNGEFIHAAYESGVHVCMCYSDPIAGFTLY